MPQPYTLLPRVGSSMAEEWLAIGVNHHVANRFAEAEQAYVNGLRVDPNCVPIITNLAVMAAQHDKMQLALLRFERAALFDDANATMLYNYALALLECERSDEALAMIERSIKAGEALEPVPKPHHATAYAAKGMILTSLGRSRDALVAYDQALERDPKHPLASYNTCFARTLTDTTPADAHAARKRWHEHHRWAGEKRPHDNDRTPDRLLRVGYVGGDFKMHSAAFIFGAVILNHDRGVIEPHCYMSMPADPNADARTKAFMEKTTWRDISAKTDDEAEAMIRADKIDILVDLAGHTGGNRLALFTRKPAPVQAHGWGFAHGTGCPEVDWFLADEYAVPADEREHFAEKIWDLPTIVGYEPPQYGQPGTSPPPVGNTGAFTFGVFGRFEKFSPRSIEAWHKILLRTPGSRLLLKDLSMRRPYVIRHVREVMHDIDPKRILFMQDTGHSEQMLSYQGVDLVLDTFPHTGGVTALEMLYMGVPVITLYNGQVGGRTTSVVLRAIGREGWIADSVDDYVRKAVKLAADRSELGKARAVLREEMLRSKICGADYARAVETAYRRMWWRYCGHADADTARGASVPGHAGAGAGGLRQDDRAAGAVGAK